MKELERWWHWFDNEKPDIDRALGLKNKRLSDTERGALRVAASLIECRKLKIDFAFVNATGDETRLREALQSSPAALRDLSLDLCRGLERLNEQVAVVARPPGKTKALPPARSIFDPPSRIFDETFLNRQREINGSFRADQAELDRKRARDFDLGGYMGHYSGRYALQWAAHPTHGPISVRVDLNTSGKP